MDSPWRRGEMKRLWSLYGDIRKRRDCGHCMETYGSEETVVTEWRREVMKRLQAQYGYRKGLWTLHRYVRRLRGCGTAWRREETLCVGTVWT